MRIAFDLRWIRSRQIDGISRYAINLMVHLLHADSDNDYMLIGDKERICAHVDLSPFSHAAVTTIDPPLLSPSDFLWTHRAIERLDVDIFHVPNYLCTPFRGRFKKILTVFDLIPFLFPEALSRSRALWRWFYRTRLPARAILRSTDTIITTSEHTKADIVRLLKINPAHIQVVWCGIEARFHPNYSFPPDFFETYDLPQQFLLYVGRQDPYKGLNYLIQAYAMLPEPLQQQYALVIAGKSDPRYIGAIHELVDNLHLRSRVRFLDYIPDTDLPRLYSAATLLVHPSLYEGFGLPPLEAMACGTPVVYAETSSLTEHIGGAGFAVTPASAGSLAHGMDTLLAQEELRKAFAENGLQWTKRYAWDAIARKILTLY